MHMLYFNLQLPIFRTYGIPNNKLLSGKALEKKIRAYIHKRKKACTDVDCGLRAIYAVSED